MNSRRPKGIKPGDLYSYSDAYCDDTIVLVLSRSATYIHEFNVMCWPRYHGIERFMWFSTSIGEWKKIGGYQE